MCSFQCTGTSFPWINLFLIFHSLDAIVCVCACSVVSYSLQPHGLQPARLLWNSPGQNTGEGCHFLLQRIFPTWKSNPSLMRLLHWQVDSLPLRPLGSPRCYCKWHYFLNCFTTCSLLVYCQHKTDLVCSFGTLHLCSVQTEIHSFQQ